MCKALNHRNLVAASACDECEASTEFHKRQIWLHDGNHAVMENLNDFQNFAPQINEPSILQLCGLQATSTHGLSCMNCQFYAQKLADV